MKISEAIAAADAVKPNAFEEETKFRWLNELEGALALQVFLMAPAEAEQLRYSYPEDLDTVMLVDPPYDQIYPLYLQAKIDAANGEYNQYANTMSIYNAAYAEFVGWFCQLYDPAEGYVSEEVFGNERV